MLGYLFLRFLKNLRFEFQEAIRLERKRLRREGIFTYPDMIYNRKRIFDPRFPGLVKLRITKASIPRLFWRMLIVLYEEFMDLLWWEKLEFFVSFLALSLFYKNIKLAIQLFYTSFKLKIAILTKLGFTLDYFFWNDMVLLELEDFMFLYENLKFFEILMWKFLCGLVIILPVLLIIAYSTLLERKILSAIQWWRGPNKVGIKGSTQPLVDGIKLILKEIIIPVQSESKIFILSSIWTIFFMLVLWFIVPTSKYGNVIQLNYELLVLFSVSTLGSISIILAGWSSNSKYAFLGGIRAGAQMISYELVLGLIILIVMAVTSTTQIIDIVDFQIANGWLVLYLPFETTLFLILIVAETNRAPFDFAEAESELVSGYNTEYSGLPFAFFFIAEYGNILYMSLLTSLLFFGGWSTNFLPQIFQNNFLFESIILFSKTIFIYLFFLWLRGSMPRYW
jgi:NADH-quinone oxidoreductase subunit H